MHAVDTDRLGRARRSAAGVLALAVVVGSCGVGAALSAALGVAWSGLALLVVLPLIGLVAVRAWRAVLSRPLGAPAVAPVLVASGGGRR